MHYKIVLLDSFHLERVNGHTLELHAPHSLEPMAE